MPCPFCGTEMRRGTIGIRGFYAYAVSARFTAVDDTKVRSPLLPPSSLFGRGKRWASCCPNCEAILTDPIAAPVP